MILKWGSSVHIQSFSNELFTNEQSLCPIFKHCEWKCKLCDFQPLYDFYFLKLLFCCTWVNMVQMNANITLSSSQPVWERKHLLTHPWTLTQSWWGQTTLPVQSTSGLWRLWRQQAQRRNLATEFRNYSWQTTGSKKKPGNRVQKLLITDNRLKEETWQQSSETTHNRQQAQRRNLATEFRNYS